jgi:hypothetical protein
MIGLDTYKFTIPGTIIGSHQSDKFKPVPGMKDDGELYIKRYQFKREKGQEDGLTFISINGENNSLTVQASSNFISYNPMVMLTKENVSSTLDKLQKHIGVEFKYSNEVVIRNSKLWLADFAKTIPVESNAVADEYMDSFKLLDPRGFAYQHHDNKAAKGGFAGKGASFKNYSKRGSKRIILYNKLAELSVKHPEIYKALVAQGLLPAGLLRGELNAYTPSMIAKLSGSSDSMLGNVLNGTTSPFDLVFEEVIGKSKLSEYNPMPLYAGLNLTDLRDIDKDYLASNFDFVNSTLNVLNTFGTNEDAIRAYFYALNMSRSATSKRIKKMRPIIQAFRAKEMGVKSETSWIVREIKHLQNLFKAA